MAEQEIAQHQPHNGRLPLSKGEVVKHLSACLALVRPVGMGDDAATEWLAVAAAEVIDMPRWAFVEACKTARHTCTHHGQIIPHILAYQKASDTGVSGFAKEWDAALVDYSNGYTALPYDGGPKRLGDVLKGIEYDGDR